MTQTTAPLSWKDRMDIERQVARFEKECGPVTVYKMSESVTQQQPLHSVKRS